MIGDVQSLEDVFFFTVSDIKITVNHRLIEGLTESGGTCIYMDATHPVQKVVA